MDEERGGAHAGGDLDTLAAYYHEKLTRQAREYLRSRGLSDEIVERFGIGFDDGVRIGFEDARRTAGLGDYFKGRVVFPVRDTSGRTVEIVGRAIDDKQPKYKNLTGRTDVLFHEVALAQHETVILCEGIIDALTLIQVGVPAVAVLGGRNFRREWAGRFAGKKVFICFGNDDSGRRNREAVAQMLDRAATELYLVGLPPGVRDVNDLFARADDPITLFGALLDAAVQQGNYSSFSPDTRSVTSFFQEFVKRQEGKVEGISTGFPSLDAKLFGGLREGVYMFAGAPAVGKTSFLRQMADHIASATTPVLFFSLEMSSFELWAKSIARILGVPISDVLTGKALRADVERASREYEKAAVNLSTVEGNEGTSVEVIRLHAQRAMNATGRIPVIFLDYLQRIAPDPATRGLPGRARNSEAVFSLKRLSRGFGCPIVFACSLPRVPAAHEEADVLQEAGEAEHTVDFAAVMRPAETLEPGERIRVTLEIIKNRNGPCGSLVFEFDKATGRFTDRGE